MGASDALPRGDAQPATVDDRHVELAGVVGDRTLHGQQPAGGVEVVGEHVDDGGRLPVDRQRVGHRDGFAVTAGRLHVDPDGAAVEGRVAVRRVVVEEERARLGPGEGDDAVLGVGLDDGASLPRELAAEGELGVGVGRVRTGQVVEERTDLDRLAHLAAYDVGLGRRGEGLLVELVLDLEGHRAPDRRGAAVGDRVGHLDRLPSVARSREAHPAVGRGAGDGARHVPADGGRRVEDDGVTVRVVTPVGEHRHRQRPCGGDPPHPRLVAGARLRCAVVAGTPDRHGHRRVRGGVAPVVDVVLEARAARVVGQGQDDGLAVRADLGAGPSGGVVDLDDAQQAAVGRRVVVERVEDRGASGTGSVAVRLGLGRAAVAVALLLVLLVLLLDLGGGGEGVPVVDPLGLEVLDVPHRAGGAVVEDDLAAVDPQGQGATLAPQVGHGGLVVTAPDGDVAQTAGPRGVLAGAEAHGLGRLPVEALGEDRGLAAGEVDAHQAAAAGDQDGVRGGPRLLQHRVLGDAGGAAAEHGERPGRGVERDDGVADRRHGGRLTGGLGEVLGAGLADPVLARDQVGDGALGARGHDDGAGLAHRERGTFADLVEGVGLAVDLVDDRPTRHGVDAGGPDGAGLRVDRGERAAGELEVAAGGHRDGAARLDLRGGGVDQLGGAGALVDREHRGAVLDDVERAARRGRRRRPCRAG